MTHAVVMYSGGMGSYFAAVRAVERWGVDGVRLLFTDTKMEDQDLYRFLEETTSRGPLAGVEFVKIQDGRDVWEVLFQSRMMGGPRMDPCSRILKRDLARRWMDAEYATARPCVVVGIGWDEGHRLEPVERNWAPYPVWAPMTTAPYLSKSQMMEALQGYGIAIPRLYLMGMPHNNCGGFCVKAGQAQFRKLLEKMPDRYAYHEKKEQEFRAHVGKDVAILVDRRGGGPRRPLTLRKFRERCEAEGFQGDLFEYGGCGCFA